MSHSRVRRTIHSVTSALALVGLSIGVVGLVGQAAYAQERLNPARDPNQVPTARYARGEPVD